MKFEELNLHDSRGGWYDTVVTPTRKHVARVARSLLRRTLVHTYIKVVPGKMWYAADDGGNAYLTRLVEDDYDG